jgi:phosphatidate cytidylyltransferase
MLFQRVITALVLLAVLVPALWASSPWPFALLTLLLIAAAAWEWACLNGVTKVAAIGPGALLAFAGIWAIQNGLTASVSTVWWWTATVAWLLGGAWVLYHGPQAWPRWPAVLRLLLGMLLLWTGWLALASARAQSIHFVLSVLCVVWVADIGAYFAGHQFGRRKLAPSISPGKTWEGAVGGVVAVWLLAALWTGFIEPQVPTDGPSLFARLHASFGWLGLAAATMAMAGMSVMGDLFESLVKRAAGAKDSSRLLPGHGGVLDRIDALLPVLPAALALVGP